MVSGVCEVIDPVGTVHESFALGLEDEKSNVFSLSRGSRHARSRIFQTALFTPCDRKLSINLTKQAQDSAPNLPMWSGPLGCSEGLLYSTGRRPHVSRSRCPIVRAARAHPPREHALAAPCAYTLRADTAPPIRALSSVPARPAARPSADDHCGCACHVRVARVRRRSMLTARVGSSLLPAPWWLARRQPKAGGPPLRVSRRGY